ncbi:MAG: sodium-dependent transporter [Sphingomonas bacterium]
MESPVTGEVAGRIQSPEGNRPAEVWTSRLGFLYATAAAAIGLGSLWRFPYVAGANGGGAFVLLYILFVLLLCIPLMVAEMAMGRRGHGSVVASVRRLIAAEGASRGWMAVGWFSLAIPFFGMSYYSVVAGWGVDYAREAVAQGFAGMDASAAKGLFERLIGSPLRQVLFQSGFILAVAVVVALGVQKGIEMISRVKMIVLSVILIGLVVYNAMQIGLGPAVDFLLRPDFSMLTGASVLTALGQALFSTAIGAGVLMTYSAYLPRGVSIPSSAGIVSVSVIVVALLAGLAIFPIVLASGLKPSEGPNLVFVTLPIAFGSMPGGRIISIFFFGLIALGAFTTCVGMLEPVVAWLIEATGKRRAPIAFVTATAVCLVGVPSSLSFNLLKSVHPLGMIPIFHGKTMFDLLDFGIAELLLPINALLIALFCGWALRRSLTPRQTDLSPMAHRIWHVLTGVFAPIAIVALMIDLLSH